MKTPLKRNIAIPSKPAFYNGILFRSRLEVRWAVLFDCLGIEWEYETVLYKLKPTPIFPRGVNYLPDFHLKSAIIEIKPNAPVGEEIAKALGVLGAQRKPFVFLIGKPGEINGAAKLRLKNGRPEFGIIPIQTFFGVSQKVYSEALKKAKTLRFH
jgi:hypothetical protein